MKKLKHFALIAFCALATTNALANSGEHTPEDHNKLCPIYFQKTDTCAQVEFTQGPFDGEESQFIVHFYEHQSARSEHIMVTPQQLKIDLWMYMGNHGGHGSAPVSFTEQSPGVYLVSNVYFIMPGRWNIRFFVENEQKDLIVDIKPSGN